MSSLLLVLGVLPARAQAPDDRQATEQQLRALREQIAEDERRLSQAAEAEQDSQEKLRTLEREVAVRRELISQLRRRLDQLDAERDSLSQSTTHLERQLERLRRAYRRRATHAYQHGRLNDLALILSAPSINQMLIRVRYLSRFADQRRRRLGAIERATHDLEERRRQMLASRAHTADLLAEAEAEQRSLARLQDERQQLIADLRSQRQEIEQALERERAAAEELENRIRVLIAEEATRRRERAAANPEVAEEFAELSGSFLQNRGQLPRPAPGVVVEAYGEKVNPVYGTVTPNPGILIATRSEADVRAVFEGEVIGVGAMPEYGVYVLVQHGAYQSFYGNFSTVYVTEGDHVHTGQALGKAGTDAEPRGAGVFFALFQEGQPQDPGGWLRPQ